MTTALECSVTTDKYFLSCTLCTLTHCQYSAPLKTAIKQFNKVDFVHTVLSFLVSFFFLEHSRYTNSKVYFYFQIGKKGINVLNCLETL